MSDFGKRVAASIRAAEKQQEKACKPTATESGTSFVERESLTAQLSLDVWRKFKGSIVSKCKEVNSELGKDYYIIRDVLPNKLKVSKSNPVGNLKLTFVEDGYRIYYDVGSDTGEYLIGIDARTGQAILSDEHHQKMPLESTAEFLLEDSLANATL